MAFLILGSLLLVLLTLVYYVLTRKYGYWKQKNVPHMKPTLLFGNYKDHLLLKSTFGEACQKICRKFPNEPYVGAYIGPEPALIIQDPELVKLVTAKDFYYFNGRESSDYQDKEVTTQNLFYAHGEKWKVTRQSMTPLFTPTRMKNMYYLIQKCAKDFKEMLAYETNNSKELNGLPLMSRYTIDCIGTTAFGIEINAMEKNYEKNPFYNIANVLFEISYLRAYGYMFRSVLPGLFYGLGFTLYPKKMTDFFFTMITNIFKQRNDKASSRNDFIDLILTMKEKDYITCDNWSQAGTDKKIQIKVTDEFLVSQSQVIFGAGFETSALTSSFFLYEIAKNETVQQKALDEVDRVVAKYGEDLEYDHLGELTYLEACMDETMRLYPAIATMTRDVIHDYTLPSGVHLEKGLIIHIPILHFHYNPKYFPEPESFKPERFLPENKDQITPFTYMPFGEGARKCIGYRFGKIMTLTGLFTVLKDYRIELADGMPRTLKMEPRALINRAATNIRLKFIPRN